MTRINVVPVEELTDAHLIAEYRELPRVFKLSARHERMPPSAPTEYTMNRGHVTFFYDKLRYCRERQRKLIDEMVRRGFNPKFRDTRSYLKYIQMWSDNDYKPTLIALARNRKRIADRLAGR